MLGGSVMLGNHANVKYGNVAVQHHLPRLQTYRMNVWPSLELRPLLSLGILKDAHRYRFNHEESDAGNHIDQSTDLAP